MIEIRDTIGEKSEREYKDKWQRADWSRRGFSGYSDEEKKVLDYIYDTGTKKKTNTKISWDEAMQKAMNVERKFREADGIEKVNPLRN